MFGIVISIYEMCVDLGSTIIYIRNILLSI